MRTVGNILWFIFGGLLADWLGFLQYFLKSHKHSPHYFLEISVI